MHTVDEFLTTWAGAELAGDADALDQLLHADFVGVGPLGFALPKQAWLGRYRGGSLRYDRFDLDEVQTRVHDRAAVVTARQNQRGTAQGHPIPEAARVTLVLTDDSDDSDDGGGWRLAGAHLSFIAGTVGSPPLPRPVPGPSPAAGSEAAR